MEAELTGVAETAGLLEAAADGDGLVDAAELGEAETKTLGLDVIFAFELGTTVGEDAELGEAPKLGKGAVDAVSISLP